MEYKVNREKFGYRLKQLRKSLNMSQIEFAELIGITQGALSKYERGAGGEPELSLLQNIVLKTGIAATRILLLDLV